MSATATALSGEQSNRLTEEVLDRLLGAAHCDYDLRGGKVVNLSDVRIIYLSADLVRGIHAALRFEVGEATGMILKNCGYIWGKRVATSLKRELRLVANTELDAVSVEDYVGLIERYFAENGWGVLDLNLDQAQNDGIVRASLRNSLFEEALEREGGRRDYMVAGMLQGIFEAISGHALDCVQVCDSAAYGAALGSGAAEFLVSAPARIKTLDAPIEDGVSIASAIDLLRDA